MIKVLFVMEGGGALSQDFVRGPLYKDLLLSHGIQAIYIGHNIAVPSWLVNHSSRFINRIVDSLEFKVLWKIVEKIGKRFNRHRILKFAAHCSTVVFVKVSSLYLIKQVQEKSKGRILYDLSDALWLPFFSKIYPDIQEILTTVDAVTWDYQYTLAFAKKYNKNVYHWPAASQVELFDIVRNHRKLNKDKNKIVIGWVGSSSTLFSLYLIWEALEKVFEKRSNIHLRIVGGGKFESLIPHFENVTYSILPSYNSDQMINEVLDMDIGLFPLFDVEDSCVRGFLKALVYMSGETAVIASPRGQIPELIKDGVNGMLANSTQEWVTKLELLIHNHELRQKIAKAGLETARRDFNLQQSFESLLQALDIAQAQQIIK